MKTQRPESLNNVRRLFAYTEKSGNTAKALIFPLRKNCEQTCYQPRCGSCKYPRDGLSTLALAALQTPCPINIGSFEIIVIKSDATLPKIIAQPKSGR